jgi:hypothetical protein
MSRTERTDTVVCELVKIIEQYLGEPVLMLVTAKAVDTCGFYMAAGWEDPDVDLMFEVVREALHNASKSR